MRFIIKSRRFGEQSFWANAKDAQIFPHASAYVFLETSNQAGCLGDQICEGGGFRGPTVTCDGTPAGLARTARRWWRQRYNDLKARDY